MAFVGRMNSRGKFVDCEMYSGGRSKVNTTPNGSLDEETEMGTRRTKCSRTYIKSYDHEPRLMLSSPSTVRYVGRSASSCELNSMADTEMSTLRCSSPRSLETDTVTLTPENNSENSSLSDGSGAVAATAERIMPPPRQQMLLKQYEVEEQQLERGSTTSMCSWEEEEAVSMYTSMDSQPIDEPETRSCCAVPLLELGSDTASLYYDQQVQLDQLKLMRRSNEAYDNWLSGKKRQYQYKQQAAREQRELKQRKEALRQQLNEQRVQEWCQRKARQCNANTNARTSTNTNTNKHRSNTAARPVRQQLIDETTAQRRLQGWELKKMQQAEQRRQLEQREQLRKQREQQQRKQQAALAWQQWVKGVAQRPKPVPLNQGLNTLRGTVSNIYINPKQWVNVNEKTRT
ncbi:coiled-coil domain-containing protein 34 [Drosophila novamexicana]|uniref:coiled-coil domain-containing protein 34 n=1 Tax=Drosophila novamexicana TaxID=47314 RepID=UPI0011E595E8|nr:coiled-coil domain-containing protein 34 [Drosophila novamexicana]